MKVIIAGCREGMTAEDVNNAMLMSGMLNDLTEVVSGAARGVDSLGEEWAQLNGYPVRRFPADWGAHGRAAGPKRNGQMAAYADGLVAVWDGKSRGTADMIRQAKAAALEVSVLVPTRYMSE